MNQSKKWTAHRFCDVANKIHNVCIVFVPVLVCLGVIVVAELIQEDASMLARISVAVMCLVLSSLTYAVAVLAKLLARILEHFLDLEWVAPSVDAADAANGTRNNLTRAVMERMAKNVNTTHDAICPSCELEINQTDTQCPRCHASFVEGSPWAPIPKNAASS